jgi:hypothetical protein
LLWIALAAALSPSILNLVEHVTTRPWARCAAVFPFLLGWLAWRRRERVEPAADGFVWLALGLAFSVVGAGGDMPRLARPGIALGIVGLARATGFPPTPIALLAAFAVPLPSVLLAIFEPGVEDVAARAAAALAGVSGAAVELDRSRIDVLEFVVPAGALELVPGDGALSLGWALAGVGWFGGLLRAAPLRELVESALGWGFAAVPIQAVGVGLACAASLAGRPAGARILLDYWPLLVVAVGLWRVARPLEGTRSQGQPTDLGAGLRSRA